MGGMNTDWH